MATPLDSLLENAFHAVSGSGSLPIMMRSQFAPPPTDRVAVIFYDEAHALRWEIDVATGSRHVNGAVASTVLDCLLPEWTTCDYQMSSKGRFLLHMQQGGNMCVHIDPQLPENRITNGDDLVVYFVLSGRKKIVLYHCADGEVERQIDDMCLPVSAAMFDPATAVSALVEAMQVHGRPIDPMGITAKCIDAPAGTVVCFMGSRLHAVSNETESYSIGLHFPIKP